MATAVHYSYGIRELPSLPSPHVLFFPPKRGGFPGHGNAQPQAEWRDTAASTAAAHADALARQRLELEAALAEQRTVAEHAAAEAARLRSGNAEAVARFRADVTALQQRLLEERAKAGEAIRGLTRERDDAVADAQQQAAMVQLASTAMVSLEEGRGHCCVANGGVGVYM